MCQVPGVYWRMRPVLAIVELRRVLGGKVTETHSTQLRQNQNVLLLRMQASVGTPEWKAASPELHHPLSCPQHTGCIIHSFSLPLSSLSPLPDLTLVILP